VCNNFVCQNREHGASCGHSHNCNSGVCQGHRCYDYRKGFGDGGQCNHWYECKSADCQDWACQGDVACKLGNSNKCIKFNHCSHHGQCAGGFCQSIGVRKQCAHLDLCKYSPALCLFGAKVELKCWGEGGFCSDVANHVVAEQEFQNFQKCGEAHPVKTNGDGIWEFCVCLDHYKIGGYPHCMDDEPTTEKEIKTAVKKLPIKPGTDLLDLTNLHEYERLVDKEVKAANATL